MEFSKKPSCRIFCKTSSCHGLTIKDSNLILATFNPNNETQCWYKEFANTPVLDTEGRPSFAIVNKYSGQAIKRSTEADKPLSLVAYNPDVIDINLFWSESSDSDDDGYKAILTTSITNLCFHAQHAENEVQEGTAVVLRTRNKQNNQWWKIENDPSASSPRAPTKKIAWKPNSDLCLAIRCGGVVLAKADKNDEFQHWYKDDKYGSTVKDQWGWPGFVLVNKATGQAIMYPTQRGKPVRLAPYYTNVQNKSVFWSFPIQPNESYAAIRGTDESTVRNEHFYPFGGLPIDGAQLLATGWDASDQMRWSIQNY